MNHRQLLDAEYLGIYLKPSDQNGTFYLYTIGPGVTAKCSPDMSTMFNDMPNESKTHEEQIQNYSDESDDTVTVEDHQMFYQSVYEKLTKLKRPRGSRDKVFK
jgi:hypothetical protein